MGVDLVGLLEAVAGRRVVVVGDAILDVYLRGATRGLCREAPAPVVAVQACEMVAGGAANTATNLAALGGQSTLVSVVGDDAAGRQLRSALRAAGVAVDRIVLAAGRRTIVKRRVMVGSHLLMRLDEGTTDPVTGAAAAVPPGAALSEADALVISDNGYGTLPPAVIGALAAVRESVPVVVVDARQPAGYAELRPSVVTPNYAEAVQLLGSPAQDDEAAQVRQIRQRGADLLAATGAPLVVVTLGAAGAILFERDRPPFQAHVPERTDQEVVGAGDVFAAALALALSAQADPPVAVEFATLAAATAAAQAAGTAVASREQLLARLRTTGKVLTPAGAAAWAREAHRQGLRISFTNGCFDLVHEGHIAFLSEAKALGDVLVVGVNDDESVRMLKGPERPVVDLAGRMRLLAALSCVDHVAPFSGPSPVSLIEAVRPHVFAKGGDYTPAMLPEADLLHRLGTEIRILSYLEDRSTSRIIARMRSWS